MGIGNQSDIAIDIQSNNTSGSIVQVAVRWTNIQLSKDQTSQSESVAITVVYAVNPQGASSGGRIAYNRRLDVTVISNSASRSNIYDDSYFGSQNVSAGDQSISITLTPDIGDINYVLLSFTVTGQTNIAAGPAKTNPATASILSKLITIEDCLNKDFTFITGDPETFLRFPFANNGSNSPRFFKIIGAGKRVWLLSTAGTGEFYDFGNSNVLYFDDNWGCLTLIPDGISKWLVANYYPSTNQGYLSSTNTLVTNSLKIANASSSSKVLNIFSTDTSSARQSGDNLVNLPSLPSSPGMCIVAYTGGIDATRGNFNALQFSSNTGFIDYFDVSSSRPYIVTDTGNNKSTSAVFITDGTRWYVAGWFNTAYWVFNGQQEGGTWQLDNGVRQKTMVIAENTNKYYYLPVTTANGSDTFFHIIKAKTVSGSGVRFNTYEKTQSNVYSFFNTSGNVTTVYWTLTQTNTCVWMIAYRDGNGWLRWIPILGYTPQY